MIIHRGNNGFKNNVPDLDNATHYCSGIPDIGDIDRVEVSYIIFNQNEKKLASTAKIRKALS